MAPKINQLLKNSTIVQTLDDIQGMNHISRNYIVCIRHNWQKDKSKIWFAKKTNWIKMTDQKAEDDIENLEKSAKVDSKMESEGYLNMNPSLPGTSESM